MQSGELGGRHALTVPPDGEAISVPFARCFVKIPLSIGFIGRCVDPPRPIWTHSDRHAQAQAARDSRRGCRTVLALRIRLLGRQAAAYRQLSAIPETAPKGGVPK
jgi:hypothetical protein